MPTGSVSPRAEADPTGRRRTNEGGGWRLSCSAMVAFFQRPSPEILARARVACGAERHVAATWVRIGERVGNQALQSPIEVVVDSQDSLSRVVFRKRSPNVRTLR